MLINLLLVSVILLGIILYYIYYIAPRLDPLNKAEQYISQNQIEEAVIEYRKVLERRPDDFVLHYKLANLYLKLDEIDQAIIHFEKVLSINKYNYEVEKVEIQKKLARAYSIREEYERSFQMYMDIMKLYPVDYDALYNVAFISLGQEEFEISQKYFSKLVKVKSNDFDILFGAGISFYQTQNISEAINYFKQAASIDPNSDINNISLAFALQKRSDYKQAMQFISKVSTVDKDAAVVFIVKRFLAFLHLQSKRYEEAIRHFEELITFTKSNSLYEETLMSLYDAGFCCVMADRSSQAYEYWNELYAMDKSYRNVQTLVTILRREMEVDFKLLKESFDFSVNDYVDDWLEKAFPKDFLWKICGLKSDFEINIRDIATTARISTGKDEGITTDIPADYYANLEKYVKLDNENFRIISNRLISKMGFKVDQILLTYRETDGVDFLAVTPEKEKVLVWVRRWTKTKVGEIPLRNFAQAINDMKARKGVFVTTADLTSGAENSLQNLSKVTVVKPEEVAALLSGLV